MSRAPENVGAVRQETVTLSGGQGVRNTASGNVRAVSRREDGRVAAPHTARMTTAEAPASVTGVQSLQGHVAVMQTWMHSLHGKPASPTSQIASPNKNEASSERPQNDAVSLCHNFIWTHQSGELALDSAPKLTESYRKPGLSACE